MKLKYILASFTMATVPNKVGRVVTAEIDHLLAEPNLFHFEPLVHFDDLGHFDIPNLNYAKDSVAAKVSPQLASKNAKRRRIGNTVERTIPKGDKVSLHSVTPLSDSQVVKSPSSQALSDAYAAFLNSEASKSQNSIPPLQSKQINNDENKAIKSVLNEKITPLKASNLPVSEKIAQKNAVHSHKSIFPVDVERASKSYQSAMSLLANTQVKILNRAPTAAEFNEMRDVMIEEIDAMINVNNNFERLLQASEKRIEVFDKLARRKLDPLEQYQLAHAMKNEMEARSELQRVTEAALENSNVPLGNPRPDFDLSPEEEDFLREILDGEEGQIIPDLSQNLKFDDDLKRKLPSDILDKPNADNTKIAESSTPLELNFKAALKQNNKRVKQGATTDFDIAFAGHEAAWKKLLLTQSKVAGRSLSISESVELRNSVVNELEAVEKNNVFKLLDASENLGQMLEKLTNRKLTPEILSELKDATKNEYDAWKKLRIAEKSRI